MDIRMAMEEAFERGEKIKEHLMSEMMNSQTVNHLLQNELFLKSLTKVLNTKYELKRALKTNFKSMLKVFNVPTREEISSMERKLHRLESEVDGIHRKILTTRLNQAKKAKPKAKARKSKKSTSKASRRS